MNVRRSGCSYRHVLVLLGSIVVAFLASGCLWGVVRDANTGAPITGAEVVLHGATWPHATTDANGIFVFGPGSDLTPAAGRFYFVVQAPGYGMLAEARDVNYLDNPNANPADPASIWEVQGFDMKPGDNVLRNTTEGYSIIFPSDWDLRAGGNPDINESNAWGTSPERKTDRYSICEIRSDTLGGNIGNTPEDFWANWSDSIGGHPLSVVDRSAAEINGIATVRIVFTDSGEGKYQGKGLAYVFSRGQEGWFIDCFVRATQFEDRLPTFEAILRSFKFDSPAVISGS